MPLIDAIELYLLASPRASRRSTTYRRFDDKSVFQKVSNSTAFPMTNSNKPSDCDHGRRAAMRTRSASRAMTNSGELRGLAQRGLRGVKLGPANRGRRLDAAERQAKVIEAKAIDAGRSATSVNWYWFVIVPCGPYPPPQPVRVIRIIPNRATATIGQPRIPIIAPREGYCLASDH